MIFICYRRILVIAKIGNIEKLFKGPENCFCYRRISNTGGSVFTLSIISFRKRSKSGVGWGPWDVGQRLGAAGGICSGGAAQGNAPRKRAFGRDRILEGEKRESQVDVLVLESAESETQQWFQSLFECHLIHTTLRVFKFFPYHPPSVPWFFEQRMWRVTGQSCSQLTPLSS